MSAEHIVWGSSSSTGSFSTGSFSSSTGLQEGTDTKPKRPHLEQLLLMGSDENSFSESKQSSSFAAEANSRPEQSKQSSTTPHPKEVSPHPDADSQMATALSQMAAKVQEITMGAKVPTTSRTTTTKVDDDDDDEDEQDDEQGMHQLGSENRRQLLTSQGFDVDELLKKVPLNERGFPTSLGSIGHYTQKCMPVCSFRQKSTGCANGVYCNFCHFTHGMKKRKVKDGKSKRERYRKVKEDMMRQIEANPDSFILDSGSLPDCIAKDEWLMGKLRTRLKIHQDETKKLLVDL
jgi:hypothetical protein